MNELMLTKGKSLRVIIATFNFVIIRSLEISIHLDYAFLYSCRYYVVKCVIRYIHLKVVTAAFVTAVII